MGSASESFSRQVSGRINSYGSRFMFAKPTRALMKDAGIANPVAAYVCGRGGVLGDVAPAVVQSAFGFMHPDMIANNWNEGTAAVPARTAASAYREGCFAFGREMLADIDGIDQFADLAESVIDVADVAGLALFAGWKAEPRPSDAPARAALALQILREYRGGAHVVAIVATGVEPRLAVAAKTASMIEFFGWGDLTTDADLLTAALDAAEDLTDAIVGPAFASLTAAEQTTFDDVLSRIATKLDA